MDEVDEQEMTLKKMFNMSDFVKDEPHEIENFIDYKPSEFITQKLDDQKRSVKSETMDNHKDHKIDKPINSNNFINLRNLKECIEKVYNLMLSYSLILTISVTLRT